MLTLKSWIPEGHPLRWTRRIVNDARHIDWPALDRAGEADPRQSSSRLTFSSEVVLAIWGPMFARCVDVGRHDLAATLLDPGQRWNYQDVAQAGMV